MNNRLAVRWSLLLLLVLLTTLPSWCRSIEAEHANERGTGTDDTANHSHGVAVANNEVALPGHRDDHPTSISSDVLGRVAVAGGAVGLITGGPIHGLLLGLGTAYMTAADPRISGAYWAGFLAASVLSSRMTLRVILGVMTASFLGADGLVGEAVRHSSELILSACRIAADLDARYDVSLRSMENLRGILWKLRRDCPGCVRFLNRIGDWKTEAFEAYELLVEVERMHNVSGKLGEFFTVDHEWWEERGFYHWWEESRVYAYEYFKRVTW